MAGKIRRLIIFALILYITAVLFCIPVLAAQEPSFRIDMDRLNFQKGVSVNIIISMINAPNAEIISIEEFENFDVLSQSSSTVTSIVGGETTYQEDLYYTVMPKSEGQFTIKANIRYNGQIYETNALQVNVSEISVDNSEAVSDLFIKTIVSHTDAYLGEKIILTYELYSRYSIDGYGFTTSTAIDGVIAKENPDNQLKAEYVYLGGERYAMYEVKQLILDPIKTGGYVIPPFNFQVNVLTSGGRGGFGGFFRSTTPMYLQTETKEFTVKPLPTDGKPDNFSGIVGELQLESRYSRDEMNYGDSFVLYVTASGNCNLDGIKNNIVGAIPGFSVYETQKNTAESVENNKYHIEKAFEVILVPEKNGVLEIAPVFISYFNPVTKKYEKAEISGITVNVLGDMPQPDNNNGGIQTAAIEPVIINQVKYTDSDNDYFTLQMKKQTIYAILAVFWMLVIILDVLLQIISKKKKKKYDPTIKSIYQQLIRKKDINEIYNLFNTMIKHKYNLNLKASSQNNIMNSLPDADLAMQVTDVMNYMESPKIYEQNGYNYLIDKIKGIYRNNMRIYRKK